MNIIVYMEMLQGKEMNKDIVEFSYRQCSPLKRAKLSESIKEILNIKTSSVNSSKNKILNYIIESLKETTLSIKNLHKNRSNESIDNLLLKYHKSNEYLNGISNKGIFPYKEINDKERKKISMLIKDNSEIKKDNYKVMFESLFIVINELLYPKKKLRHSAIMSPKPSVLLTTPNSPRIVSRMMSKTSTIKKAKPIIKSNVNDYICHTDRNERKSLINYPINAKYKKTMIGPPKLISNTYVNKYLKINKESDPLKLISKRISHKKTISIDNKKSKINSKTFIINASLL